MTCQTHQKPMTLQQTDYGSLWVCPNGHAVSASSMPPEPSGRPAKPNKYRNEPTKVDGIRFASKREANRWCQLQMMERAGVITQLKRQVSYALTVNDQVICRYVADFTYIENGRNVVEDAKGMKTPVYELKKRLMKVIHKIEIQEV